MNRRGQALFLATGQFVAALKYVGLGLGLLGLATIATGFVRSFETVVLGVLMAGVGAVCFVATNYFATLAEISVTMMKLELEATPEPPSGDKPYTLDRPAATAAPTPAKPKTTPPPTPRKPSTPPPEELPPIPLAGDEEKPS